jgi:membrane fusion protein (multidrug efflux system)
MDPAPEVSPGNGREREDDHERDHDHEREREREREREPVGKRAARWRKEHPRGTVLLVVGAILLVAAGVIVWWYFHTHESTDNAQIDGHIAPLSSRVAGTVVAVHVEDNQNVDKGQLLVELDPRDYQVALERAEAELEQAKAQLAAESPNFPITATTNVTQISTTSDDVTSARAAIIAAERDHQAALARVQAAVANQARADADLARYKYLLAQRAIPQERYDAYLAANKSARAETDSARALAHSAQKTVVQQEARLKQAESRAGEANRNAPHQLSIREANIAAKKAAVQAAEAAVERARLDLEYTRIVAPFAGIVGNRSVEIGQHVLPGEQLLAVVDLDDLWVTANFKETQLRHLRPGQSVRIKVDALAEKIDGTVESFSGASGARYSLLPPENATGNFVKVVQRLPVRIRFAPNQDVHRRLRPGMSVEPNVRLR